MLILFIILSYIIGSIPTAVLICRLLHNVDIKKLGSGNPGTANVIRNLGLKTGLIVFFIDTLKGFLLPFLYLKLFKEPYSLEKAFIIGFFAVVGHIFSIFSNFKGGKGVATSFGVGIATLPFQALLSFLLFLLLLSFSKVVSISALISFLFFFIFTLIIQSTIFLKIIVLSLFLLVIFKHKENIVRFLNGEENKLDLKKLLKNN